MQDLGTLGGSTSRAGDINSAKQVVGSSRTASSDTHAVLWEVAAPSDDADGGGGGRFVSSLTSTPQKQERASRRPWGAALGAGLVIRLVVGRRRQRERRSRQGG